MVLKPGHIGKEIPRSLFVFILFLKARSTSYNSKGICELPDAKNLKGTSATHEIAIPRKLAKNWVLTAGNVSLRGTPFAEGVSFELLCPNSALPKKVY